MAVEIMGNYGGYEAQHIARWYAANGEASGRAGRKEVSEYGAAGRPEGNRTPAYGAAGRPEENRTPERAGWPKAPGRGATESVTEYAKKLAKLAPSTKVKVGSSFPTEQKGRTLTINPALLRKMQQDPEQEKETKELIRSIENLTKWLDGMDKAAGKKVIYRRGYIDENGKYYASSCVGNERAYKMSEKLREERRRNTEALIERTREKAGRVKGRRRKPIKARKPARTGSTLDIRL